MMNTATAQYLAEARTADLAALAERVELRLAAYYAAQDDYRVAHAAALAADRAALADRRAALATRRAADATA